MSYAHTNDDLFLQDPEIRESIRVIRRERSWHLIGVAVALVAALVVAILYTYLSYSDQREVPNTAQHS